MEIKVKLNNLRTAPMKVRQVVDLIRGKRAAEAQSALSFTVNKSARPVLKLLNSAIASAKHDFQLDEANLFVSKVFVDEGPKLKRWHPMSRGRAYPIIKRTSHITLVLAEKNPTAKQAKNEKIEKPKIKGETNKKTKEAKLKKKAVKKNKESLKI
jgi:large subunit ribosomal protein L22